MSIIFAILIFCVIVVAHEFGHLLVAKANGINVKEFWVGFGPSLFSFTP
ncbi:MAG: site-2 protease family protein [Lachnospiraceae bacterium]|nr:site-2 protease family protein [Lachnospiraceae bacterium]